MVRDDFRDVDIAGGDQFQRLAISARSAVGIESARSASRCDQSRFDELDVVHHAQVNSVMTVSVQHDGGLFPNQVRNLFEQRSYACGFD